MLFCVRNMNVDFVSNTRSIITAIEFENSISLKTLKHSEKDETFTVNVKSHNRNVIPRWL